MLPVLGLTTSVVLVLVLALSPFVLANGVSRGGKGFTVELREGGAYAGELGLAEVDIGVQVGSFSVEPGEFSFLGRGRFRACFNRRGGRRDRDKISLSFKDSRE